jgi:hypothetical protein
MSLADDVSRVAPVAPEESPRHEPGVPQVPAAARSSPARDWSTILAAGILGGLAGFGIGEASPRIFAPDLKLPPEILRQGEPEKLVEIGRRLTIARDRAAAISYGGLGASLGLCLGVAGALMVRRSATAVVAVGLIGLVLGGAAGAGATRVLLPLYDSEHEAAADEERTNDLALALKTHGGIWVAVGAAAGLALGLGLGGWGRLARATIGGILGGLLAAAIYEFAGAVVFPLAETFRPMANEMAPRLLAHLAVGLFVAVAALGLADYMQPRRARPQTDV